MIPDRKTLYVLGICVGICAVIAYIIYCITYQEIVFYDPPVIIFVVDEVFETMPPIVLMHDIQDSLYVVEPLYRTKGDTVVLQPSYEYMYQ